MPLVNIHCHVSHARYGPDRTLYSEVHFLNSISDEYAHTCLIDSTLRICAIVGQCRSLIGEVCTVCTVCVAKRLHQYTNHT